MTIFKIKKNTFWHNSSHLSVKSTMWTKRYCLGPELNGILPCYNHKKKQQAIVYWDIWKINQQQNLVSSQKQTLINSSEQQ